jgi:ATP-dependent helicase/nuclease subunit B
VALRGGDPAGELKPIRFDDGTPDAKSDEALRKLTTLITKFEDETIGYLSKERPMFMRRGGGDYDHLARVKEWSLTGGAAEDAGDAE